MDKKLKAKWERILKREGLEDIESNGRLKQWHGHFFKNRASQNRPHNRKLTESSNRKKTEAEANLQYYETKQEYYYKATHFLTSYPFESIQEKRFWELHASGKSNREIEKIMKLNRRKLSEIMYCLVEAMKVWKY